MSLLLKGHYVLIDEFKRNILPKIDDEAEDLMQEFTHACRNFVITAGSFKFVDTRLLPESIKRLYNFVKQEDPNTFTDLEDAIPLSTFKEAANVPSGKFLNEDNMVYVNKRYSGKVIIRLPEELLNAYKHGKIIYYIGFRKFGRKMEFSPEDISYYEDIIVISNSQKGKNYFFGIV